MIYFKNGKMCEDFFLVALAVLSQHDTTSRVRVEPWRFMHIIGVIPAQAGIHCKSVRSNSWRAQECV